jgi:DNA mismatch repair ATPase MutS
VVVCHCVTTTTTTTTTFTASATNGTISDGTPNTQEQQQTLSYYCYQDHTHTFCHTISLLQRCLLTADATITNSTRNSSSTTAGEKTTIHIGSTIPTSANNNSNAENQSTKRSAIVERLLRFIEDLMETTTRASQTNTNMDFLNEDATFQTGVANTTAMAPEMSTVQFHDSYFTNTTNTNPQHHHANMTRLQSYVNEITAPTSTAVRMNPNTTLWLQLTSDMEFQQSSSYIVTGLFFYFYSIGQWPNPIMPQHHHPPLSNITQLHIQKGSLTTVLMIDPTAAAAIHLFSPHHNIGQESYIGGNPRTNSIYAMLVQHCRTTNGKHLLYQWLQQPLIDLSSIVRRQTAVAFWYRHSIHRDTMQTQGLQLFVSCNLHTIANTLSYYASIVEENQMNQETNDNNSDNQSLTQSSLTMTNRNTNKSRATKRGPGWNTRKALMTMYQLYLISSQKVPLLTELLQTALSSSSSSSSSSSTETGGEDEESSEFIMDVFQSLQHCMLELERSVHLIETVMDLEQAPREYVVQAEYRNELLDITQELNDIQQQLQTHHDEMNQLWCQVSNTSNETAVRLERTTTSGTSTDIGSENGCSGSINSTSVTGYQFRLLDTNDSKILQTQLLNQVTVHKVLKNGVYFTTKTLRQLSQQHADLCIEYDKYQKQIVQDAIQVAATYAPVLHRVADTISQLDVVVALAHTAAYSTTGPYCRPIMTDSDECGAGIVLQQARHPCVELQDSIEFIPNDYNLVLDESSFLIVTGPNSTSCIFEEYSSCVLCKLYGPKNRRFQYPHQIFLLLVSLSFNFTTPTVGGKSTYIRSVGAIVTMAQIGSFVPCTSATINICQLRITFSIFLSCQRVAKLIFTYTTCCVPNSQIIVIYWLE